MTTETIVTLVDTWREMTSTVLEMVAIPNERLQAVLDRTHEVLMPYRQEAFVPKEVCCLFWEMDEFLYFAALMEEKEVGAGYYRWLETACAVKELKEAFLGGEQGATA